MKLDSNKHSVLSMYYFLVLVMKYCRQEFDSEISNFAKEMFVEIGSKIQYLFSRMESR